MTPIMEAMEALSPFAREADQWSADKNGGHEFMDAGSLYSEHNLTIGDLRRARTALASLRSLSGDREGVAQAVEDAVRLAVQQECGAVGHPNGKSRTAIIIEARESILSLLEFALLSPSKGVASEANCDLCVGKCRGHSLGHAEQWEPEPGSRASLTAPSPGMAPEPAEGEVSQEDALLVAWDALDAACQRILTSQPERMSEAAATLDRARIAMRETITSTAIRNSPSPLTELQRLGQEFDKS